MPSTGMSRLVVVMIRHTTLLVSYLIFTFADSLLRVLLGSGADFANMVSIIINLVIYMLYPVGDKTHEFWCIFITKRIFFCWHDHYTQKRSSMIDKIAIQISKQNDQLQTGSVQLECITTDENEKTQPNTITKGVNQPYDCIDLSQSSPNASKRHGKDRNALDAEFTNWSSMIPNLNEVL